MSYFLSEKLAVCDQCCQWDQSEEGEVGLS
jgi:hypothetical protein